MTYLIGPMTPLVCSAPCELSAWLSQPRERDARRLRLGTSTTQRNDLRRRSSVPSKIGCDGVRQTSLFVIGDAKEMHPIVRDEVYRIGHEAIRNACTHSLR